MSEIDKEEIPYEDIVCSLDEYKARCKILEDKVRELTEFKNEKIEEYDAANSEFSQVVAEYYKEMSLALTDLTELYQKLKLRCTLFDTVQNQRDNLQSDKDDLTDKYEELGNKHRDLIDRYAKLDAKHNALKKAFSALVKVKHTVTSDTATSIAEQDPEEYKELSCAYSTLKDSEVINNSTVTGITEQASDLFETDIIDDEYIAIKRYIGYDDITLSIPNRLHDRKVLIICPSAFKNCKKLESITIPESVKVICEHAFSGCTSLNQLILNEGLERIENEAFYKCAIKQLCLPSTVNSVGEGAFKSCKNLSDVKLSGCLVYIGTEAFCDCAFVHGVYFIYIPKTVKFIGYHAFSFTKIYQPDRRYKPKTEYWYNSAFTIICDPGSYAMDYARTNNFSLDKPSTECIGLAEYNTASSILVCDCGYNYRLIEVAEHILTAKSDIPHLYICKLNNNIYMYDRWRKAAVEMLATRLEMELKGHAYTFKISDDFYRIKIL